MFEILYRLYTPMYKKQEKLISDYVNILIENLIKENILIQTGRITYLIFCSVKFLLVMRLRLNIKVKMSLEP